MVTDGNWTCDHLVMYKNIKSTCCTSETNIICMLIITQFKKYELESKTCLWASERDPEDHLCKILLYR